MGRQLLVGVVAFCVRVFYLSKKHEGVVGAEKRQEQARTCGDLQLFVEWELHGDVSDAQ